MATLPTVTSVEIEGFTFPSAVKPPASKATLFLGGAGVRGLEIEGKFVKFTAIGVYLESTAVPALAVKWKGKSAEELTGAVEFYRDIVTGPFEKFIRVTTILPLTGRQYSEKVSENCIAFWKSVGIYTDTEAKAIEKFLEIFKEETFPPGSSILFTQFPSGSLAISFSKDGSSPETEKALIENKLLSEAILESIIGKHGVSPATRQSLGARISELLTNDQGTYYNGSITAVQVETCTFPPTAKPPASNNTLFLGGAGVRGVYINGNFVKVTAIGVYLEDSAVPSLAVKWKGKSAQELTASDEFYRDIVTGPFEKFVEVSMILPLSGPEYAQKVSENSVAIWKSRGIYSDAEVQAIKKFSETFKEETLSPGSSSILFTQFPSGSLAISFTKDGVFPKTEKAVIENKLLSETVLETIIGKNGVSPTTRQSLAERMSKLLTERAEKN